MFVHQDQVKQSLKKVGFYFFFNFICKSTNHIVNHDVIQVNYENLNNQLLVLKINK